MLFCDGDLRRFSTMRRFEPVRTYSIFPIVIVRGPVYDILKSEKKEESQKFRLIFK